MALYQELNTPTSSLFFEPLEAVYPDSSKRYDCHGISDLHFAALGTLRCISHAKTGHEFLQHHANHGGGEVTPSHFFKALQSPRRIGNLSSLNTLLRALMASRVEDPFAPFRELDDFDIFAADGHYHHAACFDPKPSKPGESTIATGHFFRLDLRSHHLGHLDMCRPEDGKKKGHDTLAIKRAEADVLRDHAPAGRKVIYAWDKACIDYRLWHTLKHNHGVYFVTREKANSAAENCSPNLFDTTDPRNAGIHSDHLVGASNGVLLRRIVYTDPRDDSTYTYLTSEFTLPAWLVVLLYKQRWVIEKVFDELKSKMNERKSWASSQEAKTGHALFECLAHNLAWLFELHIRATEGMRDEVEESKASKRIAHRKNREGKLINEGAADFIQNAIQRATQRTVRFIRWLRSFLYQAVPWSRARARLAQVWGCKS